MAHSQQQQIKWRGWHSYQCETVNMTLTHSKTLKVDFNFTEDLNPLTVWLPHSNNGKITSVKPPSPPCHAGAPRSLCLIFTTLLSIHEAEENIFFWGSLPSAASTISPLRGDKPAKSAIHTNREQSGVWFPALGLNPQMRRKREELHLSVHRQMIMPWQRGTYGIWGTISTFQWKTTFQRKMKV